MILILFEIALRLRIAIVSRCGAKVTTSGSSLAAERILSVRALAEISKQHVLPPVRFLGFKEGDVILEVSGQTVASPDDVLSGIKKAQDLKRTAVLLHVKSADQKRFVAVQLTTKKG